MKDLQRNKDYHKVGHAEILVCCEMFIQIFDYTLTPTNLENCENRENGLFLNKMLMKYTYARAPARTIVVGLDFSLDLVLDLA